MKDRQGVIRGKCILPGCECSEYMAPQDSNSARCEYCDHVPVKHVKMIKLGACMKCHQCQQYETEEPGSYSNCGYCECPAQHHQGAEKLVVPNPATQISMKQPTTPAGLPFSGPRSPGQCKFPGCTKTCFIEKGRVHEFCGKTHADLYKKQAVPPPMMYQGQQPVAAPTGVTSGSLQITSSKGTPKKCEKCQANPANPGFKLCQQCFVFSKMTS